jgi:hypothetical protein
MSRPPAKRNPAARRGFEGAVQGLRALYSGRAETTGRSVPRKGWESPNLPRNWRDRLPDPGLYYPRQLGKLTRPNGSGYAQAKCCFHEDGEPSLSVQLTGKGAFKCFACGANGDLVSFHMRKIGADFKHAVLDLVRGVA